MKKPGKESYERFADMFGAACESAGKEQHLVPYYISGHPGTTDAAMISLALYLKKRGIRPRQVQDFIPTPMSMATAMYYTGYDPFTRERVFTARTLRDKRRQKALLLYWDPAHHELAREALIANGRGDLIGSGPHALVPPASGKGSLSIHARGKRPGQKARVPEGRPAGARARRA